MISDKGSTLITLAACSYSILEVYSCYLFREHRPYGHACVVCDDDNVVTYRDGVRPIECLRVSGDCCSYIFMLMLSLLLGFMFYVYIFLSMIFWTEFYQNSVCVLYVYMVLVYVWMVYFLSWLFQIVLSLGRLRYLLRRWVWAMSCPVSCTLAVNARTLKFQGTKPPWFHPWWIILSIMYRMLVA